MDKMDTSIKKYKSQSCEWNQGDVEEGKEVMWGWELRNWKNLLACLFIENSFYSSYNSKPWF